MYNTSSGAYIYLLMNTNTTVNIWLQLLLIGPVTVAILLALAWVIIQFTGQPY